MATPEEIEAYAGTYIGLSPSDESAVGMGELEVTISERGATFRLASGLGIEIHEVEPDDTEEVPVDQLTSLLENPEAVPILRALRVGHQTLIFVSSENQSPEVAVVGGAGDLLGPTLLFGPDQVAEGLHEQAFTKIENLLNKAGVIPRLSHEGRAPSE